MHQICRICENNLPLDHFYKGRKTCKSCYDKSDKRAKERLTLLALGLRKCRICKDTKQIADFKVERAICKSCDSQATKTRYAGLSKEEKQIRKAQIDQKRITNPSHYLWLNAKRRAREENLPFDIQESDIECPNTCPVLGIPLQIGIGFRSDNSPSLDKIIPNKGYVKGNVKVISYRANRFKSDAVLDEIIKVAEYMRKFNE